MPSTNDNGSTNRSTQRYGTTRRAVPNDAAFDESLTSGAVGTRSALGTSRLSRRTTAATTRAADGVRRSSNSNRRNLLVTVGAVVAVAIALVLAIIFIAPRLMGDASNDGHGAVVSGQVVEVVVPEGSGASAIAQILYEAGVVDSPESFLTAMRRQEAEQSLKSGSYSLYTGMNAADAVRQLVAGPNSSSYSITVPEGFTVQQIAALVETNLGIPASDFIAQAKASNYVGSYSFLSVTADDSLEGFLFPKTYDFAGKEVSADSVIRAMLDQYKVEVSPYDWDAARSQLQSRFGRDFSNYDVLIIASIIERETNTPAEDGAHVASVICNRLAYGMMLQCDSTSVYANNGVLTVEIVSGDWNNPYNTYANYGLPPTPICSPSIKSIEAALYPDRTDDCYFFIQGDYHVFSVTYEEHLEAIANAPAA